MKNFSFIKITSIWLLLGSQCFYSFQNFLKNHFKNILNCAKTEMKLAGKENEIAIYNLFFKFC